MTALARVGFLSLMVLSCRETQVSDQRCVDSCTRRILTSYDDGAPLAAETLREWIAYCERSRGPCCESQAIVYLCDPHRKEIP